MAQRGVGAVILQSLGRMVGESEKGAACVRVTKHQQSSLSQKTKQKKQKTLHFKMMPKATFSARRFRDSDLQWPAEKPAGTHTHIQARA